MSVIASEITSLFQKTVMNPFLLCSLLLLSELAILICFTVSTCACKLLFRLMITLLLQVVKILGSLLL